jgi:hypothetical protein
MLYPHFGESGEQLFYTTLMDIKRNTTDKSLPDTPVRQTEHQQVNEAPTALKCTDFHLQQTGYRV